jgi:hypothetical protein
MDSANGLVGPEAPAEEDADAEVPAGAAEEFPPDDGAAPEDGAPAAAVAALREPPEDELLPLSPLLEQLTNESAAAATNATGTSRRVE